MRGDSSGVLLPKPAKRARYLERRKLKRQDDAYLKTQAEKVCARDADTCRVPGGNVPLHA